MPEIHGHITGPVVQEVFGDETSAAVLAAATLIPVLTTVDFSQSGGSVRIDGTVYEYTGMDDGDVSGVPSITLATGLSAGVDANTAVELWNASAGTVISEWKAPVTSDQDGTANTAKVSHVLVPLMSSAMPLGEGDSVLISVDSAGGWTIVDKLGATPAFDPGYITTGTLAATTTVIAGDPDGKRVQMDGTGTPAFEAYNAANVQTVNIDGEDNYIEGTLATAASGDRVEIGEGPASLNPINEVRFYTGANEEQAAGFIRGLAIGSGTSSRGQILIQSPNWDTDGQPAKLLLSSDNQSGSAPVQATLDAETITLSGETSVTGNFSVGGGGVVNATMGTGSVGTGTFRDSVDARVAALAQPSDSDLTAIAALTTTAYGRAFLELANQGALMALLAAATDTAAGIVELATTAETTTGTDTTRATTPAGVKAVADTKANLRKTINSQTGTSYTLVLTDEDKVIQVANAATHTLTVPPNSSVAFTTGATIKVARMGGGAVTIAPGAGVTLDSRSGLTSINGLYGEVTLRYRGTDRWHLTGDLA